jgi:anti-sigma regulatory factor (Ser/Thr protein kinase)
MRTAMGDRRRVEQILTNLAANGLKFTPAGGIVEIDGRFDGAVAVLVVRDDGPGISVEDRPRIFERFHRLSTHERITGTGLGLPIARELARLMAGDLDVASVPGAGSAFVIVLPGPADASSEAVVAALARALGEEEVGLEERAVLRAMALGGRGGPTRQTADGPTSGSPAARRQKPDGRHGASPSTTSRRADG